MGRPVIVLMDRQAGRRAEVRAGLGADDLAVVEAESEQAVTGLLATLRPQMLVVGVQPGGDLSALCATMQQWPGVPILALLDAQPSEQIAVLLECGADDYLRAPFTADELRTRVQGLLRRTVNNADLLRVGNGELVLNPQTQTVQVRGATVELTPTEYRMMWQLAQRAGAMLTYAELLAGCDPLYATDPTYLAVYVWHLRQKLERDPHNPLLLQMVDDVGYRLLP